MRIPLQDVFISHPQGDGPAALHAASSNPGAGSGGGAIKPSMVTTPLQDRTIIHR